jgi:hypothetical protein
MLALLAALQIAWNGPGLPSDARTPVPALIAPALPGRITTPAITLRATMNGEPVPALWHVNPDDAIAFASDMTPRYYDPTAPETPISVGSYRGPATIDATYANATASLDAFVYDSVGVGCFTNFPNGVTFSEDGRALASGTPYQSDIFFTGAGTPPQGPAWTGCTGPFISLRVPEPTLRVPYGGTIVRYESGAYFGYVPSSAWRNEFTVVPPMHPGDILIFRTHDNRIVKFLAVASLPHLFGGPYLLAGYRSEFADVRYYTRHKYAPHAVFGHH